MIQLFDYIKKSSFVKNLAIVMSGTVIAQVIGFALTPVLSRFFSPADFGVFGSFNSVLGVVAAISTFQYSQALMLPKEDSDAANILAVSILSVLLITLLGMVAVCLFPQTALSLFKSPGKDLLLWLFPAGILFNGLNQSLQAWCIRRKAFTLTSASQVVRTVGVNAVQVVLGVFRSGGAGLVTGIVAGDGVANINLSYMVLKKDWLSIRQSVSLTKIKRKAYEYRDFPIYSATQNAMNALSQGLPVLFLGYYYDVAIAGAYAFGVRILQVPMNLVLTALRQVLFQKASESYNNGQKLYPLFLKTTLGLLVISIVPTVILFVWAPTIFSWLFGKDWLEAGIYARWLILWLIVAFCNLPSNLFARILRQQRNLFLFELLILFSRIIVLVSGGLLLSAAWTIICFSVAGCILNILFILWIGILLKKDHVDIAVDKNTNDPACE